MTIFKSCNIRNCKSFKIKSVMLTIDWAVLKTDKENEKIF